MKLNDDLYVLMVQRDPANPASTLNLSLLLDAAHGPTLVDAALPGQYELLAAALAGAGVQIADLRRILLTHHDIDHVGVLHELVQASGARVLASADEAPFIDGSAQPRFASPEALAQHPALRDVARLFKPTRVDELLHDGVRLDLAGGVQIIATPGHTPGHTSFFLERTKTLIAGDALTAPEGRLAGPNPSATPDMAQAAQSVRRLAALDLAAIVCYHGGVVREDASGQLRRVAEELEQARG